MRRARALLSAASIALCATLVGCGSIPNRISEGDPASEDALPAIYRALWADMSRSAWMLDGNIFLSEWHYGEGDTLLHIEDLRCFERPSNLRCRFTLRREGPPADFDGRPLPERIFCEAPLVPGETDEEVWQVVRRWHPNDPHSFTTISCRDRD